MSRRPARISRRTLLASSAGAGLAVAGTSGPLHIAASDPVAGVAALIAQSEAIHGVVIIDPADSLVYQHNAWAPFVSASLYKLILLAEILRTVEAGDLSLDDEILIESWYFVEANGEDAFYLQNQIGTTAPLQELIYATGAWSSNVAALALLALTTIERLNAFCGEIGMTGTHFWAYETEIPEFYPGDNGTEGCEEIARAISFVQTFATGSYVNLTTPGDMSWYMRLLRDDALVSEITSWRLKDILSSRAIPDRIPALLPPDAIVMHKTGNLTGVLHDVGIVSNGQASSIVVTMAQAVTNLDFTFAIEQRIGLVGYELLTPASEPNATPAA